MKRPDKYGPSGRWVERVATDELDSLEDRAASRLRKVLPPPSLSGAALSRIAGVLQARPIRSHRAFRWAALGASLAALTLLLVGLVGHRAPSVARKVRLAGCASQTLIDEGGARVTLLGPGAVTFDPRLGGALDLHDGRLAVRAGAAPLIVDAPGARVTVLARGLAEVQVASSHVVVAAFRGGAAVQWHELGRVVAVAPGTAQSTGGPVALPSGAAEDLTRILEGAPSVQRCADPLPTGPSPAAPPAAVPAVLPAERPAALQAERPAALQAERPAALQPAPVEPERAIATRQPIAASQHPIAASQHPIAASQHPIAASQHPIAASQHPIAASEHELAAAPPAPATSARASSSPAPVALDTPLTAESRLVGAALKALRRDHDSEGALALLDEYQARFPSGTLQAEAQLARVDALLASERRAPALALLDNMRLAGVARAQELQVVRGELRAQAGRCREAIADFDGAAQTASTGALDERLLYGRAACRARAGDGLGARADLAKYLERHPHGRFAADARRALAEAEGR